MRGYVLVLVAAAACVHSPTPLKETVVRVDQEPPGPNCKNGGVAISTGIDLNNDGVLEDNEIQSTQYVCNGATAVTCPPGGATHSGTVTISQPSDAAALAGIGCIDGDLIVSNLSGQLPPLPDLTTVTGEVVVAGNPDLKSLGGFSALTQIGQSYLIQGNGALTDITMLAQLDTVLSVFILGNDALQDLAGLSTLTTLSTGLTVSDNQGLISLHGLENIVTVTGGLRFVSNHSLDDISALSNLRSAGLLELSSNASLTSISLPSLQKLGVRLLVQEDAVLTSVSIPKLATMSDGVVFTGNPELASVSIASLLTTGTLDFENDPALTTIDASCFAFASEDVNLTGLTSLTNANFAALKSVGGTLRLYNSNPSTLAGLSHLQTIGALWMVENLPIDFIGLSSLQSVAGDMTVANNPNLTSFSGLSAMTEVGGNLVISANPMLPITTAQQFASSVTVVGSTTIN